jgi:hypothetical protein
MEKLLAGPITAGHAKRNSLSYIIATYRSNKVYVDNQYNLSLDTSQISGLICWGISKLALRFLVMWQSGDSI